MRILIVEDDHKIANSIKRGLEQEAFSVDVAYTGYTGYDVASTEPYDCVVLDLMLPELSGVEICQKLRVAKINTPVLMLTAKGEVEDKVNGLNSGADDYLTKPFAFEELLARIRALLRRPQENLQLDLSCKGLTLNSHTFKVQRVGIEINLTKKEFSLLEYLLRNKNVILSKDQILAHVWDYESDVLPNTVEQYIKYLRNKIEEPFKNLPKIIQTVRGFGYMVKEQTNV